jgi:hypothetical protein
VPKQYDSTLNAMIDGDVAKWGNYLATRSGVPLGPITALDTDLSTTLQADRLFLVDGLSRAILHLELESSGRLGIPAELLRYNVAAWGVHELPVHSIIVLLRPKANASDLTGHYEIMGADNQQYLSFRYTVLRIWEQSVDSLLVAGSAIAPLALLTNEAATNLQDAFHRLRERLHADGVPDTVERVVLGSTYVLCGLRYAQQQINDLYRNLSMTLEESTTYQFIFQKGRTEGKAEGRLEEAQPLILRLGTKRFNPAPAPIAATIRAITDHDRLERMAERVVEATDWDDLLATS